MRLTEKIIYFLMAYLTGTVFGYIWAMKAYGVGLFGG